MPLNFIAKAAITVALSAANMALTMTRKIEGPRLDSTKFTGGDYGAPLFLTWGLRRLEVPIFWAEDLKEVKQRRKTKGGKFNDYTYYGTWAVAVAGHEVDAIRRIWFDTHLVYDMSGAGPVTPFDFGGRGNIHDFMTIYLGTETQEPDPRIQATTETKFGEGSCPAYRGTTYIVFKDVPVEKLGNRIPQVSVEVSSGEAFPTSTVTVASETAWIAFAGDYSSLVCGNFSKFTIVDPVAQAVMYEGTFSPSLDGANRGLGYFQNGDVLALGSGISGPTLYSLGGGSAPLGISGPSPTGVQTFVDSDGQDHYFIGPPLFAGDPVIIDGVELDLTAIIGATATATYLFADLDNDIWVVGLNGTDCFFHRLSGTSEHFTVSGLTSNGGYVYAVHYRDATHDQFVIKWSDGLYAIDRETEAVVASNTSLVYGLPTPEGWRAIVPGSSTIWCGFEEISLADLSSVRVLDSTDWGTAATNGVVYDPISHALITRTTLVLKWNYLDRVGTDGVTLGAIASDIADMVGVLDYDFSALDQIVQGWSATQGQASNMLEPLLDAYDSDIRPHDFTLQGKKRAGTSGGTILTERFVANEPRYSIKVRQAAELPRALIYNFADVDADQQPNNVRADRPLGATGARGEQSIDMSTWALDKDEARGYADRHFRRLWNERKEVSLSLTAQQLALEPGDCRTLDLDGETDIYRLTRLTIQANDVLATEWKYDHPSLALTDGASGASFDGRDPSVVIVPLLSKGFFLDVPYITDSDAQTPPILYIAAAPFATGSWPGAVAYEAIDGEYSDELGSVASSSQATWGSATELPYANPNLWDRGSSITVTLQTGSLAGTTEAAIDANPSLNLAAIGAPGRYEFVNFTVATLTAPNTYTVSGFKRGRRGTEWAAELHDGGDLFLLLDTADDVAMGLSEVGTDLSFKMITAGRTSAFPQDVAPYTGASLKPYAPCHLTAVKDSGSGDWTISWVRRTRVGGAWTSGTSIPLSETTEAYEVEILNGATVVRTITGLTSATATWSAAQQTTDFGSGQSSISYRVYQISDAVDRGFAAAGAA